MGIYKYLQVSCTRHNVTQYIKSLTPYNTVHLISPLYCWNLLQRSNPAWRGSSPRWSSSSSLLGPLRGHYYVGFPIGDLMSARAIHPRRWRPPIMIQCDLMLAIAISAGPHRPYLGRCDQCHVGHLNSAITHVIMKS